MTIPDEVDIIVCGGISVFFHIVLGDVTDNGF